MASPFAILWLALALPAVALPATGGSRGGHAQAPLRVHLGPRPFWLIDQMAEGPLKTKLTSCSEMEMRPTAWSIAHRGGGTLQFPEGTRDSIVAGVSKHILYPPLIPLPLLPVG